MTSAHRPTCGRGGGALRADGVARVGAAVGRAGGARTVGTDGEAARLALSRGLQPSRNSELHLALIVAAGGPPCALREAQATAAGYCAVSFSDASHLELRVRLRHGCDDPAPCHIVMVGHEKGGETGCPTLREWCRSSCCIVCRAPIAAAPGALRRRRLQRGGQARRDGDSSAHGGYGASSQASSTPTADI